MKRYILQRLLLLIPTLFFISTVTFLVGYFAPGDPIQILAGEKADPAIIARVREQYGLNQPVHVQYARFLINAMRLDFGISYYNQRPVRQIILDGFFPTVSLACIAIFLASCVGIILGIIAAWYKDRLIDRFAVLTALLGVTIPNFVLAPLLVFFFSIRLNWFPVAGWGSLDYMILPAIVLAARPTAMVARLTRTSVTEILAQDFIRAAYAKGLSAWQVLRRHILRNAMLITVTGIGNSFGFLLTGSFIVETAFGVPGLGYKSVQAIQQRDYPVIQATTLLFATLFILVNLLVDLIYLWLDPRVKHQEN